MTVSFNVHSGLPNWVGSTNYKVGQRVRNAGNCYQCLANGTSAAVGGPSGVNVSIADSSTSWTYKSVVDYTGATGDVTFTNAQNGLPATFTQNVIWSFWNDGPITTSATGTPFLNLTGHTIAPFYLIITTISGESFRDSLQKNQCPLSIANTNLGATFVLPNGVGGTNYFNIADNNVIIDGFQFQDPFSTSGSTILQFNGTNFILQNCILDGFGQGGGANMVQGGNSATGALLKNCLFIDRSPSSGGGKTIGTHNQTTIASCGLVSINGVNGLGTGFDADASPAGCNVTNSWFFGYGSTSLTSASTPIITVKNCAFDASVMPTSQIDNGGNIFGLTASNQFLNTNNDFRLQYTSSLVNKGFVDTINFSVAEDIARSQRPQFGINWDIGPFELQLNKMNPQIFKSFTS